MRILQISKKTQYALIVAFILNCIFSAVSHQDVYYFNRGVNTSLADILTFQFNTYSFIYLLFLPVFIFVVYCHLKTTKFNEFILTRYESREKYVLYREKNAILFTVMYRILELFVSGLIFILASFSNGTQRSKIISLSIPVRSYLCVNPSTVLEEFIVVIFVQLTITMVYFFFVQIILLSDFNLGNPFFAGAFPAVISFIFLALIKANYWFEFTLVRYLLPHNYTFLEFMFSGNEYSLNPLLFSWLYWAVLLIIMVSVVFYKTKHKDYIFIADDTYCDA